jgi:hypothetical protein
MTLPLRGKSGEIAARFFAVFAIRVATCRDREPKRGTRLNAVCHDYHPATPPSPQPHHALPHITIMER